MKLRNIFLSLIAAVMICNPLAAMYQRPSYAPAIVCFVGATASGVTAWWAHKKVKTLSTLSDEEKNKPEIRKQIQRYTLLRNACTTLACITAVMGTTAGVATYSRRQEIEEDKKREQQFEQQRAQRERERAQQEQRWADERAQGEQQQRQAQQARRQQLERLEEQAAIEAQAQRKRAYEEQQRRRQIQRQTPAQEQQDQSVEQPQSTERLLARGFAQGLREDAAQLITKLARAAQKANYECGICLERITNQNNFAVGSPSNKCDHFFCVNCVKGWRETGRTNGRLCPTCRQA